MLGPLLYIYCILQILRPSLLHLVRDHISMPMTYKSCRPGDALACVSAMNAVVKEVQNWMSSNRLRLNPAKTQYIWIGTTQARQKIDQSVLASAFPDWKPLDVVRDFGVLLDGGLTLADHVNSICRSSYYELRQIRVVRRTLSSDAAATLVHSFVLSRLDHCNAVLAGLPLFRIKQLQSVLNSAARLLANLPPFAQISDHIRHNLHWLPIMLIAYATR